MKILVADDHQLFIDGIQHILNKLDADVVITEAVCADQAIDILESDQEFDLILVDLYMPGMNGMSILQRMHERGIWLPLVVVSSEENIHTIKMAMDAGALGFIPKSHNSQQMIEALNSVLEGELYVPQEIEKQIENLTTRRPPAEATKNSSLKSSGITKRQYEVLQLLAKGYSNKQIATSLYLTEHTVKAHLRALFSVLYAGNRTECVQNAIHQGVLDG